MYGDDMIEISSPGTSELDTENRTGHLAHLAE